MPCGCVLFAVISHLESSVKFISTRFIPASAAPSIYLKKLKDSTKDIPVRSCAFYLECNSRSPAGSVAERVSALARGDHTPDSGPKSWKPRTFSVLFGSPAGSFWHFLPGSAVSIARRISGSNPRDSSAAAFWAREPHRAAGIPGSGNTPRSGLGVAPLCSIRFYLQADNSPRGGRLSSFDSVLGATPAFWCHERPLGASCGPASATGC